MSHQGPVPGVRDLRQAPGAAATSTPPCTKNAAGAMVEEVATLPSTKIKMTMELQQKHNNFLKSHNVWELERNVGNPLFDSGKR